MLRTFWQRLSQHEWLQFALKLILLGVLIFIQVRYPDQPTLAHIPARYLQALLFFGTAQLVISFTRGIMVVLYRRRKQLARGEKENFILGIGQISGIASFIVFVIAVLMVFNINIREALTAISIVAAAIAILTKDYVTNMVNGMIILFSDQMGIGDQIEINDQKGRIADITLLNVQIVNQDEDLIFIPNTTVMTSEVINYTRRPVKKVSIDFEMSYQALGQVETLERYLQAGIEDYQAHIKPQSPTLKVVEVRKDAVAFKFQYILQDEAPWDLEREIRRQTVRLVIRYQGQLLAGNTPPAA
ncbi:MAG: Mechanosensitive ion channel [Bacteroidetes bacterium]|nr:MAG: Mechanosensitive ion channel [Bacteroidota bacterium]